MARKLFVVALGADDFSSLPILEFSLCQNTDILKDTVARADGRIVIMGCGALDVDNIAQVRRATGVDEMHFAALKTIKSSMEFRNPHVGMGGTALEREYEITLTDVEAARATIAAARAAG